MSVQEQIPYQCFTANGETTDFYISFYHEGSDNIVVRVDGAVVGYSVYLYLEEEEMIQFFDAPEANQVVEIIRKTPLKREIDYNSYTNTLRPETLNKDIDRIWINLQEQALKVDQYDYDYNYILKQVRPIVTGGTGATTPENARTNLNVLSKDEVLALVQSGGTETVVSLRGGGTGATTASQARTNLSVYSKTETDNALTKYAILTGGNSLSGTQQIVGNLEVTGTYTGNLESNVRQHLNTTGDAPIYACRAWVNFNGSTGSIRASGNIASVVRNGTGNYTVTFVTPMADANYAINAVGTAHGDATSLSPVNGTITKTGFQLYAQYGGDNTVGNYDPFYCCVTIFR